MILVGHDAVRLERLLQLVRLRWAERQPELAKHFEQLPRKRYSAGFSGYRVVALGNGQRRHRRRGRSQRRGRTYGEVVA